MKLVAIMGSPHNMKGNTGKVLESLLAGATGAGAEATVFCLGEMNVAPCRGCDACHKVGKCAINDDFHEILAAMRDADAVLFASPNYIVSVSAQMKALIDRCCGPIHLMALEGKYGAAVVTSGGGGCEEVEEYILSFLRSMGCWNVGSVGVEAMTLFDPSAAPAALAEASELGVKLGEAVASGEPIPDPAQDAFRERMRQLMLAQRERWPYEYEQWAAAGRL